MMNKIAFLTVTDLRCENLHNPLGITCSPPSVSWKITGSSKNVRQSAYEITVSLNSSFDDDTCVFRQIVQSDASYSVPVSFDPVAEKTIYYWRVRVCVNAEGIEGHWTPWSETSFFETGLKHFSSFTGMWIEADEQFYAIADAECKQFWKKNARGEMFSTADQGLRRVPYLKKNVELKGGIVRARTYITARGLYELHINGNKIGPCSLAPEFTAYDKCIYYQTFDITPQLREGTNRFDILLGDGWYAGHAQAGGGDNHLYGVRPSLLMQTEIQYKNGDTDHIVSDHSFTASMGPLRYADLFMGEYYDVHYESNQVFGTVEKDYSKSVVMPQKAEPIVVTEILGAKNVFRDAEGSLIVDFGQVIAGREKLNITGTAGSIVTVEHSEEMDHRGVFYNVMPKYSFHDQKNTIVFSKEDTIIYEPQFSFQGFRYIRISGLHYDIKTEACKAVVIGSGLRTVGTFECSNPLLNQLMRNILWSQKGNMLSIPTDCPQRERAGFTGDAQIFGKAAALNMDVQGFFARWLEQCRFEQYPKGQIPIVVPYTKAYWVDEPNPGWTSAGWGDVIVFLPWELYQAYDDIRFLRDNYHAMLKWMDYVETCANETMPEKHYMDFANRLRQKYLWNTGHHWGDWVIPGVEPFRGVEITKEITAALYYYREVRTMTLITRELGEGEKNTYYEELSTHIKKAFQMEYITNEGRLSTEWQGAYVMALAFEIVDGELREMFARRLNELVIESNYHLQTGFLSTPFLLETLWNCGYIDTAYKLLYQDTPPSWLYQVKSGATTIWEEWGGKDKDGVLKGTSFNHYAFGCVCDFVYEKIGGIRRLHRGFKKVGIHPEAVEGLDYAETTLETLQGTLSVKWAKVKEGYQYWLQIPHNSTAIITGKHLPIELGSGNHELLVPFQV